MEAYFNKNGFVCWSEKEVRLREIFRNYFVERIHDVLAPSCHMIMAETPTIVPHELVDVKYTNQEMFFVSGDMVLRPELTPGLYHFMTRLFNDMTSGVKPPICVWQAGEVFRKEQDLPTKYVKLKEFYQVEFQCAYINELSDYHNKLLQPVANMICDMVCLPTRIVRNDPPKYSRSRIHVEVDIGDTMLKLASMNLRTDFPTNFRYTNSKGKLLEKKLVVAEVVIGLDRCLYAFNWRQQIQDVSSIVYENHKPLPEYLLA